ncbi:MAG: hypothetical protein LBL20_00395 [Treponema sp.]|jgi:hypothetical protein|nr:hypothetical protein [Treponema sp.]
MAGFDYKCVPVPRTIFTGKAGKDSHDGAVEAYESIIKNAAQGGWEFDKVDTVTSYQKPGCFAALFGKKEEEVNYKLLVFRKPIV